MSACVLCGQPGYYTFKNLTENILIGLEADDFAAAAENL
jgi:hypothetical protein